MSPTGAAAPGVIDVLFVQGGGAGVHAEWDRVLVDSLRGALGPGYAVHYPAMPDEAEPAAATWGPALVQAFAVLRPGAVIVAHSVGATLALEALAAGAPTPPLAAIVLLAAPFVGPGGWLGDGGGARPELTARLPAGVPVYLYHGDADSVVPVEHLALHAAAIPAAHVRRLRGRDHQLDGDLSEVARDILALRSDDAGAASRGGEVRARGP